MGFLKRQIGPSRQVARVYLAGVCVGAVVAFSAGCGKDDAPSSPESKTAGPQGASPSQATPDSKASAALAKERKQPAGKQAAQDVLDAMAAAYKKASSYADKGYVELRYEVDGQPLGDKASFTVAWARPNKVRVEVYGGVVVSDGEKLWAAMGSAPEQVLQREAPPEITVQSIYPDSSLADALAMGPTQGFSWLPVQLILLLAEDPLKTLLYAAEAPELLEPAAIGQHECDRVRIDRQEGTGVFWIDRKTHVLRRFEVPADALGPMLAEGHQVALGQIENLMLAIEFQDAQIDGQIGPRAFEFLVPDGAETVENFLPSGLRLLGRPAPEFSFVDLKGNAVTRESLAGKIALIEVWATWCDPCRRVFPEIEQVYQKYKADERVTFLAVSVDVTEDTPDLPRVEDQTVEATLKQWGVTIPIARDPKQDAATRLKADLTPTMLLLGPDGVMQDFKVGGGLPGTIAQRVADKLEKLLAGKTVYEEALQEYQRTHQAQQEQFRELFGKCVEKDLYLHPALIQQELRRPEVGQRTEPQSLKLTRLWTCTELAAPGNLLVVEPDDGPPRLLVLDGGTSVAEIGTDGAVDSMHQLELPPEHFLAFLRTGAGADGRRYFAGSANGAQLLTLLDEGFKPLLHYPKDAAENPHAGIADVQLADLDADGTLELCVSYWGVVGVQNVSLEGLRRWANRSLATVLRVAVLGPDAKGRRSLLCTNELGTLVTLDPEGNRLGEIQVPDFAVHFILSADLDGDGQPELCGLCPEEEGVFVAVGLDLKGQVLWSYRLPRGIHQYPVEPVTTGQLLAEGPRQWLLAAADGSIHILGSDGTVIDRFNYGAPITGLAATAWNGKRVLLVATEQAIDAWQVESPGTP